MTRLFPVILLPVLGVFALAAAPARVDPHHPVFDDEGQSSSCSACHSAMPDLRAPPEAANLRLEPVAVCATCHPGLPHQGAAEHVGQPLPEGVEWPSADGKIACFTCHDVHDGVAAGKVRSKLARRLEQRATLTDWSGRMTGVTPPGTGHGHPPMLRAPLEGGALCRTCHGTGP